MESSRFQLGLITVLALGLGFSLSSSEAVGYPAGAAVSYGTNPVYSFAGEVGSTDTTDLGTIPGDQDFVLTDISITAKSTDVDCMDMIEVRLATGSGDVGSYDISTRYCNSASCYSDGKAVEQTMSSGLRIGAGETLSLHTNLYNSFTWSGCSSSRGTSIKYTFSGYYTQP